MTIESSKTIEEQWRNLTIVDDFVFSKIMLDDDLCKDVLEAILHIPIDHIEYVGRQQPIVTTPGNKGVRLDVYVRDDAGTVFDVEMQAADTKELPKRARFYQAMLTSDQLQRGMSYNELKDSYVIFICSFDLFECGQRVYFFENTCRGNSGLTLGDGAGTIFLAASAPRRAPADRLDELLDYVASGKVTGSLSARLASAVDAVLDNETWRLEYMKLEVRDHLNYDRGRQEGLAEGRAEGRQEGLEEGREEGRQEGLEEGIKKLATLIRELEARGRADEVPRVLEHTSLCEQLYRELGLENASN